MTFLSLVCFPLTPAYADYMGGPVRQAEHLGLVCLHYVTDFVSFSRDRLV